MTDTGHREPRILYIAPYGNDDNPGTKERPLLSLEKARNAVRKETTDRDVVVYLRGGTYELLQPVILDERDSGSGDRVITYTSYPGEQAVLRGGIRITDWVRAESHHGLNLWKSHVPQLEYTRHLYVNGRSAPRPRSKIKETKGWDKVQDDTMEFWNLSETVTTFQGEMQVYGGYRTLNKSMANYANIRDIEFVYDVGWTHSICPVDEIVPDGEQAIINMKMPCFRDCQVKGGVQIGKPNYMENVFELMDEAGEWYYDRQNRTLYYACEEHEDISHLEIVVPCTEQLVVVQGSLDRPVKNITFKNLEFSHTTWLRPSIEGHPEVQANMSKDPNENRLYHSGYIKPTAALKCTAVESVTMIDCRFHHLGCAAVDMDQSCRSRVTGCHFYEIAGNGLQIGGFTFQDAHPDDARAITRHNRIENNYFHDIGTELKGSVAIIAGYTEGTVIAHNEVHHVAYTGISVGWGWGYIDMDDVRFRNFAPDDYPTYRKPSVARGNRIEYNCVHHVMQKLHDGGGIYTLSMQPDSKIIGNYVHSNGEQPVDPDAVFRGEVLVYNSSLEEHRTKYSKCTHAKGFPGGIYMDEATGGFEVSGNLVHDVTVPIFYHEMVKDRFPSNHIHDNYIHLRPGNAGFPQDVMDRAGLEPEYVEKLKGGKK